MSSFRAAIARWSAGRPDDDLLRWLYRGLIAATFVVLVLDYGDIRKLAESNASLASPSIDDPLDRPAGEPLPQTKRAPDRRAPPVRESEAALKNAMTFELAADGRLEAYGAITPGTAQRFAEEVGRRGTYVKTVVLRSPGGSVQDALAMGRLIRDKGFATEVESGRYCASSCPLVFAGGVERRAAAKAAIGVHQVSAARSAGLTGDDAMRNAQAISAQCQNYLRAMGIDLGVWVHAMETPRDELYYFTTAELIELKLATTVADAAVAKGRPQRLNR